MSYDDVRELVHSGQRQRKHWGMVHQTNEAKLQAKRRADSRNPVPSIIIRGSKDLEATANLDDLLGLDTTPASKKRRCAIS